jgi:hypothetical protein
MIFLQSFKAALQRCVEEAAFGEPTHSATILPVCAALARTDE